MRSNIFARVVGALGFVLLLSTVVTLFFGNAQFVVAKLLLGLAGVVAGFALGESGGVKRFFTGRALQFGSLTALSVLALVTALGVANWAVTKRPKSWDLTKDRIFTLQDDTVRTLKNLKTDVKAVAVYRLDEDGYGQAESLLRRYAALSPRFSYEMVDPYKSPEKARTYGIVSGGPRILLVAGEQKAPASAPDEQGLTNALVKVSRTGSRKVYFTSGHGEPEPTSSDPRGYGQIGKALSSEGYEVAAISLLEKKDVPDDASVVIVAGARTGFLKGEVEALERYAAKGGHLGIFLEPEADAGLDAFLKEYGIQADDDVVVDPSPAAQILGSPVSPIVMPSASHPISRELADTALVFPTARSLVALTGAAATPTPLALTGQDAWGETDVKGVFERGVARRDQGEKVGPLPLAMAVEKAVTGEGKRSDHVRLVAAGDGDFFSNKYLQLGGNRDFAMNAVGWLAEQEDRITIRPKSREASMVMLTEAQSTALKFLSVDVLPVGLLGLGLAVWMVRRSR
jgi:gliding motility-associatede transport system auxiliary component